MAGDSDSVSKRIARVAARRGVVGQQDVRRALVSDEAQRRRRWLERAVEQLDGAVGREGDGAAAEKEATAGLTRGRADERSDPAASGTLLRSTRGRDSWRETDDFLDMKAAAVEARALSRLGAKVSARQSGTESDPGERLSAHGRSACTKDGSERFAVSCGMDGTEESPEQAVARQEASHAARAERARSRMRSFVRGSPAPRLRQLHYERLAFMARQVDAAKREAEAWAAMVAADAAKEAEMRERQRVAHLSRSTENGTPHARRSVKRDAQQADAAQAKAAVIAACSLIASAGHTAQAMRNASARCEAASAVSGRDDAGFARVGEADGAADSLFATPTTQCSRSPHGAVEAALPRPPAPPRAHPPSASPLQFHNHESNGCIQPLHLSSLPLASDQHDQSGLRAAQGVRRCTSGTFKPAQAEQVLILQSRRLAEFQAEIQRMRQDWSQALSTEQSRTADWGGATWPPKSHARLLPGAGQRTPHPSARAPQRALSGCCELLDRGLECTRRAMLDFTDGAVLNVNTDTKWVQTNLLDDEMDALRQRCACLAVDHCTGMIECASDLNIRRRLLEATRRADDAERAIGVLQEALVTKAAEATGLRRALQAEKARHAAAVAAVATVDTNATESNDELRRRVQTLTLQLEASEERTLKGEKLVRKLREYLEYSQAHSGDMRKLK
eukprot:6174110-Pleurochrysis_carterae.AAC.2